MRGDEGKRSQLFLNRAAESGDRATGLTAMPLSPQPRDPCSQLTLQTSFCICTMGLKLSARMVIRRLKSNYRCEVQSAGLGRRLWSLPTDPLSPFYHPTMWEPQRTTWLVLWS